MKKVNFKEDKSVFSFIAEAGLAMQMQRSHKRHLINTFDTVASHSHHVAIIAYCLVRMEGLSHSEGLKAIAMGTLHDFAELRTGDLDFVEKHYASTDEDKATKEQFGKIPFGEDLLQVIDEYEERSSLTAKCVKDADALEQLYQEWVLYHLGNKMAQRWFEGDYNNRVPYLRTESAKRLALIMKDQHPQQWWFDELAGENIDLVKLNGKK